MSIEYPCSVCKAKPGQKCRNIIDPRKPLAGRDEHYARAIPPNGKEAK